MRGTKVKRLRREYKAYLEKIGYPDAKGVWRRFKKEAK